MSVSHNLTTQWRLYSLRFYLNVLRSSYKAKHWIEQFHCRDHDQNPMTRASRGTLLEQFRPRIGNEVIAVGHLYARKDRGVENQSFVDDVALREDVGRRGTDFVRCERAWRLEQHCTPHVFERILALSSDRIRAHESGMH
jgi:hypothetical protein